MLSLLILFTTFWHRTRVCKRCAAVELAALQQAQVRFSLSADNTMCWVCLFDFVQSSAVFAKPVLRVILQLAASHMLPASFASVSGLCICIANAWL